MFLTRRFFDSFANVGDDTGNTAKFITCLKIPLLKIYIVKCCSSDEFFTHLPMSAMMPKRPQIPSFAV